MGFFNKSKKVEGFEVYGEEPKKSYLKQSLKSIGEGAVKVGKYIVPPKSQEQIAYEIKLKEETIKARRGAFLKESVKQSQAKGTALAKEKYGYYPTVSEFKQPINIVIPNKFSKKSADKLKKTLKQAIKQDKIPQQMPVRKKPMNWQDQLNSIANVGVSHHQQDKSELKKKIKDDADFKKLMFG